MVRLISAFPGVGKSTVYNNAKDFGFAPMVTVPGEISKFPLNDFNKGLTPLFDSDSSYFDKTAFPENYIQHIKSNSEAFSKHDPVFFISSHENVRKALAANGLEYELVYPDKSLKDIWIKRYVERGSSEFFINLLTEKWDEFIDSCINDTHASKHHVLNADQGMSDVIGK